MKRITLSVINDLTTDQRVHRVACSLKCAGAEVTLVGRLLPDSLPLQREYHTCRMSLLFRKGPLFYAEYNIRLFFYLLFAKTDILVANDLDTLPANYLISRIRRKPLIYDTHEYFTGMPEIQNKKLVMAVWKSIERLIFPRLNFIYTVNNSIARLYNEEYHKTLRVIRNVPLRIERKTCADRKLLGLPADKKIILLQGAGINMDRGAEEAIQAMQYIDNGVLLIIGGGDVFEKLRAMAQIPSLADKVIIKPKMPYDELMSYTCLADLGLSLDKDTNINYRYSLPNKLFDYIQAEIPVLCTDLIEVANIVNTWQIGEVIPNLQPQHLATVILNMLTDSSQTLLWKQNLARAASELCWEKEEQTLLSLYNEVGL